MILFCLYRYFDADDRLVYIGVTWNPGDRLTQHRHKPWHADVVREERVWFEDRMDAFLAERRATHTEAPLYPSDVDSASAAGLAVGMVAGDLRRLGHPRAGSTARAREIVAASGYADGRETPYRDGVTDEEHQRRSMAAMLAALNAAADLLSAQSLGRAS